MRKMLLGLAVLAAVGASISAYAGVVGRYFCFYERAGFVCFDRSGNLITFLEE